MAMFRDTLHLSPESLQVLMRADCSMPLAFVVTCETCDSRLRHVRGLSRPARLYSVGELLQLTTSQRAQVAGGQVGMASA